MSAKWRALQHRHRFTYSSVIFPKSFLETLTMPPLDEYASCDFFAKLRDLASLASTYSQVSATKNLAASFTQLLTDVETPSSVVSIGTRLYLEILFLENSLPLHRTLISSLGKTRRFQALIGDCFLSLCEEYGDLGRKGKKRLMVSRAVLSIMGYPKMGFLDETIKTCSRLVAMDVAKGLESVISETKDGARPSPEVMEQCQEAMSCLYYLLQKFPSKFVGSEESLSVFKIVVRIVLSVLRSSAFSRDCLVAAGVSFCAALQACMSPGQLSSFISEALFGFHYFEGDKGDLDANTLLPGGDIYMELGDLSVLNRLCLMRGILTAIPRTVLNTQSSASTGGHIWTILYRGILPELCKYCENPIDSHFNFHSLTVTQICLQQIKTSILTDLVDVSGDYDPFPEHMSGRILRIIWKNLEDPLNQTVKQAHLIFDLLLDIRSSLPSGEARGKTKSFLGEIAANLLKLGPRCKGRYVPLASLTRRLSANSLLDLNSNLLFETMSAYIDDDVCCSCTSFLKCFLECLRDECWSNHGIERGYEAFRDLCLPPLLQGLVSGHSKLRSNLNTYALPVVLDVDVDSIFPMLAHISVGPNGQENKSNDDLKTDQRVAALVSLFKVSRSLALIEGDIELGEESLMQKNSDSVVLVCVKGVNVRVLVDWFLLALTHDDESLRIDAAESLFLNPKTASLPSALELRLMRKVIPLNMRCCSTAFQMKWSSLFRKFFSRVRTALERQVKQGLWQPNGCSGAKLDVHGDEAKDLVIPRADDLFHFIKWLSCFLLYSCYPSAPYERKIMAMELILIMIDVWPSNSSTQAYYYLYPYSEGFTSSESTLSLVGSIVDSWDRLRENSFRILSCFPTPLPGITFDDSVKDLIRWAKRLVCSPRVRESDAGALTFRLIFKKYVLELGWVIGVSNNIVCLSLDKELIVGDLHNYKFGIPVIEYISSLLDWLRILVEKGEKDLSEACRSSFVHGVLLTLRYTFEEVDWNSEVILSSSCEMRCLLEKLLELVMRITSLALGVVSADAWHMPCDMDDMVDDAAFLSDLTIEMDASGSFADQEVDSSRFEDNAGPQAVMVGCWLAMKEVSLLLGTIIRKIPLPCCSFSESFEPGYPLTSANGEQLMSTYDMMLDLKQLETIGDHFLQVLLKMKHNGAIDKTRAGFTALCNRLLCSNDRRLCKMAELWMEQLMERTAAKGQTVDDLLRRSAGIPAAFIAFFLAEPAGAPKKLLPRALRWLIDVANMTLTHTCMNDNGSNLLSHKTSVDELDRMLIKPTAAEANGNRSAFKTRDEGVVPTVHAFNVLRAAFNDTNLATDTSGFSAEAMIVCIRSFSSPYWEVRNSACLAYTALVRRMIGFLNIQKRESAKRPLTGLDFFHRYPALHPFLFDQLNIATELLGDGCSEHMQSNISKAIHPSLWPILILLSRLKPSPISSGADNVLDPFLFTPFIKRCATQSNLRVRVLASRALTGLISNEKLLTVLRAIANSVPRGRHSMKMPQDLGLVSSASGAMDSGHETAARPSSFNSIHGTLLQLHSLLDSNCRNLSDVTKKGQIVSELTQMLLSCSWIGSLKTCPCPTLNTSFLLLVDHMLDIARSLSLSQHISIIHTLLLELTSECLDIGRSYRMKFHDPTRIELRRQAAASYFSCLLGGIDAEALQLQRYTPSSSCKYRLPQTETSVVELRKRIMSYLSESDSTYEVRLATLKKVLSLLKYVKPGDVNCVIQIWAEKYLQETMLQSLAVEDNPKCIYYILKVIFSWSNLQHQKPADLECQNSVYFEIDRDSVFSFWDKLLHLNSTVTRMKTREILLCCMSICVKQFARITRSSILIDQSEINGEVGGDSSAIGPNGWVKAYKCIDFFINLVKLHSAPSEPVNMRKAAAESVIASGLLEEAVFAASSVTNVEILSEEHPVYNIEETSYKQLGIPEVVDLYASRVLDFWFICIQLLEDEDIGLRQGLAKDVQKYVTPKESDTIDCSETGPTQVDKVIELSFEFLSSKFGHWLKYLNFLLRWVSNCASSMEPHGDLVRTIFDKEIDNHHEEKLLISQICCYQLEKLLGSKILRVGMHPEDLGQSTIEICLQEWRLKFVRRLIAFCNKFLQTKERTDWIGGMGNHKDAFTPLYANMLGLHALIQHAGGVHCSSDQLSDAHKLYISEFLEFKRIVRPYIGNPLISNLYFLLIQSHDKMTGVLQSQESHNCWQNFDPYFLLR